MTTTLRSDELGCPSCVAKIEGALKRLPGVRAAAVHFATGRIEVEHDPARASVAALVDAVRRSGYGSRPSPW
jgi:copper chaperone